MTALSKREQAALEKRRMILDAATEVFAEQGLEGASLRAVAKHAGYTPAALYFHFDSKEALYAEVLYSSLQRLADYVAQSLEAASGHEQRLYAAAMGFFTFYMNNPRDLDLGFYLFRGGMKPAGLGQARDQALNSALENALLPIAQEAHALGASEPDAQMLMVDCFAHATGLLLLLHTGRIRMFGASAEARMAVYLEEQISKFRP